MPLTMVSRGVPVCIRQITGKDETRHFLSTLGFVQGENVTVVSVFGGNMILNVKDTRVALSMSIAQRIIVSGLLYLCFHSWRDTDLLDK